MKSIWLKFRFCLILSLILGSFFLQILGFFPKMQVSANINSSQYNAKKKQIDAEINDITSQLATISRSFHDVSGRKNSLKAEVAQVEAEIKTTNELIVRTKNIITQLDVQITENQKKIEKLREEMKKVLKEIQKNKQISPIQSIISSQNFGEAIGRIYALSSAQATAVDLKNSIEANISELELNLAKQEQSKIDLENSKLLLESKQGYLNSLIVTYQGQEDEYAKQIASLKEQQRINEIEATKLQAAWEAEKARLEAERRAAATNPGTGGGGGNGGRNLPPIVPGRCWFEDGGDPGVPAGFFIRPTSGAGLNQNFHCGHDAVDIGGIPGSNLVATAPGVVHNKGSFNVYGYGHWIMLRHILPNGRRIYSLYAHMQSPSSLSVGSSVSRGQVVGNMGCTGLCYGTHLHFMLYSESVESNGIGCQYGSSKCYNPQRFVPL